MRAVRVTPRVTVALGLLIALGLTGCKIGSTPSAAPAVTSQPASTAASAPASPAAGASSAAPASSGGFQNLAVSTAVRGELLDAFAAYAKIPSSDIGGSRPGSVYYGYDPATQTYWAMATYNPASTDPLNVTVAFQDGGNIGFFKQVGGGAWQVQLGGEPPICHELAFYPRAVLAAWALPTTSAAPLNCPSS